MGGDHETLSTSDRGIDFLERHEGVVLKAYRDVAGVWTIGPGLTAASGVVRPKPGMTITRKEAAQLLGEALRRNYEPAVRAALPGASQCEFDSGVSFHFNTGAIGRASWVDAWLARNWPDVHTRLLKWVKGGGKVLPGLKRRREEEFRLMREGLYGTSLQSTPSAESRSWAAHIGVMISRAEFAEARAAFRSLGYDPGPNVKFIYKDAVMRFQRDHDLTVDGIIGRATLTALQRRLDARKAPMAPVATAGTAEGARVAAEAPDWIGWLVLALLLLWLVRQAWFYRDVLAAKVGRLFPATAAFLRKF